MSVTIIRFWHRICFVIQLFRSFVQGDVNLAYAFSGESIFSVDLNSTKIAENMNTACFSLALFSCAFFARTAV
jgi:hypothetical protein